MKDNNGAVRGIAQIFGHALEVQADCLGIKIAVMLPLHKRVRENIPAWHVMTLAALPHQKVMNTSISTPDTNNKMT